MWMRTPFSKLANAKSDLELVYRHKDVTGFIVTEMETITICNEEDDSPEKIETIKQSIRYYRGEKKIFSSDAGWSAFPVVGSWVPCSVNTGSDPVTHVQLFETSHALRLVKDECGTEYYVHDAENDGKRTMKTCRDHPLKLRAFLPQGCRGRGILCCPGLSDPAFAFSHESL